MRGAVPDIRECVVAIQGGGVFGLSLLGQASAVLEHRGYTPLAFAGTSAGALVATLLWGGLPPSTVRDRLIQLAQTAPPGRRLGELLGPFDGHVAPEDLPDLRARGLRASRSLLAGNLVARLLAIWRAKALYDDLRPQLDQRGLFSATALEDWIEHTLRAAADLPPHLRDKPTPLTFGDYLDAAYEDPVANYRPPLILTATNLARGRLELIKSYDDAFRNVPVAAAARASASFPFAIRPRDLPQMPDGGTFADGGITANFPLWVFSQAMRDELSGHPLYDWIAYRPWLRLGLRVVDDAETVTDTTGLAGVSAALGRLATRGTRDQLESQLVSALPHVHPVRQPYARTGGPPGVLDLSALDPPRITAMFELGQQCAHDELDRRQDPGLYDPGADLELVEIELAELVARAGRRLSPTTPDPATLFRANVFLLSPTGFVMAFSTAGPAKPGPDDPPPICFPSTRSGIAGIAYTVRRPMICNRQQARALAFDDPARFTRVFELPPRPDTPADPPPPPATWTLSSPIFDPQESRLWPSHSGETIEVDQFETIGRFPFDPPAFGPVIGVLNLDGLWAYDAVGLNPDVDAHLEDPRIRDILEIAQAAAVRLGRLLIWDRTEP